MPNKSKNLNAIAALCQKLHCSELAVDLERVNHARKMLEQLQQMEIFKNLHSGNVEDLKTNTNSSGIQKVSNIFLKTQQRLDAAKRSSNNIDGYSSDQDSIHSLHEDILTQEEYDTDTVLDFTDLSDDNWLGYFRGYEILEGNQDCFLNGNKQCIELSLHDDFSSIGNYIRAGIRCFMIDLFVGTELEKQKLIFKLRESELKVSREFGFPITTTLFAMLSPRLQYTGVMLASNPTAELRKGDKTVLTTKKKYSSICRANKIYVNARFLIDDCREGDFILVGTSIQLVVTEVLSEDLKCLVMAAGKLSSRLPVRFPPRCRRHELSLEELENITFAREVGINVLVSHKPGCQQYLSDLHNSLDLLKCQNFRLLTRLILDDYKGEENAGLEWIAESYDGFFIDLNGQQYNYCGLNEIENFCEQPNILNFCPAAVRFLNKVYNMKKPIILNPWIIAECHSYLQPYNIPHILHYPDKFVFPSEKYNSAFDFYFLQNALTENIASKELSQQPFCDASELGDDTIARACVAASYESEAKVIIVCSNWPDMSVNLSHFRPKAPIYHISALKSIGEYISLYHHIIFMSFQPHSPLTSVEYVTNAFIFCVIFLSMRNILRTGDNIIFVYGSDTATKLCDKYLVYKFSETFFTSILEQNLFE